jgi:hypothetical protein
MNYTKPLSQDLSFGVSAKPKAWKLSRKSKQEFVEATLVLARYQLRSSDKVSIGQQ